MEQAQSHAPKERWFNRNKEVESNDMITHCSSCLLFDSRFSPVLRSTVLCAK